MAANIALFSDSSYVDTVTNEEVEKIQASLTSIGGHNVSTFIGIGETNFSTALNGKHILLIPELEKGDLGSALSLSAENVISNFVVNGGGIIVNSDTGSNVTNFLNAVFGFSTVRGGATGTASLTGEEFGTAFAGGSSSLTDASGTYPLTTSSLPSGSTSIYETSTGTYVAILPYGSGKIIFLAYDWYSGTSSNNWETILENAILENNAPVITEGPSTTVNMSKNGSPTAFSQTLNATDANGDTLTWSINSPASNGTASVSGTGTSKSISYIPNTGYTGSDSFVVQVSDGSLIDTFTFNVTMTNDAPVANNGSFSTDEDTPISDIIPASDANGDSLTYSKVSDPSNGSVNIVSNVFTYIPNNNYSGSDSFTFKVNDGTSDSNTATITITVNAVNNAPVITEGTSITVSMSKNSSPTAFNKILNATDANGNTLTWSISSPAGNGTASASGTGTAKSISYIPTTGYTGSDSFVVQVSDGSLMDTITINVTITNNVPVASNGSFSTNENTPISDILPASDVNGESLTYTKVSDPSNGSVSFVSNVFHYTPNNNYSGTDSFTYKVNDGTTDSSVGTINITVTQINNAPVITEGTSTSVTLSKNGLPSAFSLTLNATDANGDILTWSISSPASNGIASVSGTGTSKSINYNPNTSYTGSDSFIVQVSDGYLIDTITVNVTINNTVPVANNDSFTATEDSSFSDLLPASDTNGDILTATKLTDPSKGTVSVNTSTGVFFYTPNANANGTDSFTYKVYDGTSYSSTATITINITAVNDPPFFTSPPIIFVNEDNTYTYSIYVSDIDTNTTITAPTKPAWLTLNSA